VVPLLRAEGSEEESQVGLVVPEDVRPSEAETMILLPMKERGRPTARSSRRRKKKRPIMILDFKIRPLARVSTKLWANRRLFTLSTSKARPLQGSYA
jgi:hypothetical protein